MATIFKWRTEARDISLLIVLGFAMTWLGLNCKDCRNDVNKFLIIASYTSLFWVALWKGNEYLGYFISSKVSWFGEPVKRFVIGAAVTVMYTLFVTYFLTAIYQKSIAVTLNVSVWPSVIITIAISLFMHAREFLSNWRQAAIAVEKFEKETMEARYESLKNQVNPHFLFNSLNALANLVYEDENKALDFIDQLSEVYRYVLRTQQSETVPIEEELKFLHAYLFLQRIRFGEKLKVTMEIKQDNFNIPPLALQMLIENAIKHNVISEADPLTIRIDEDDHFVVVVNNLQKKTSIGDDSSGVGLENIRRRYEILKAGDIMVKEDIQFFKVQIPKIRTSKNVTRSL